MVWVKGQSGNPGGRPVGTRLRLQGDFFRALADDFEVNGKSAIEKCREADAATYMRIVASLMPKELEISKPLDGLSDDELAAALLTVRAVLAAQGTGAGIAGPEGQQQAVSVPALPETV